MWWRSLASRDNLWASTQQTRTWKKVLRMLLSNLKLIRVIKVWRKVGSASLFEWRKANPSLQWFLCTQSTSLNKCLVTMSKFVSVRLVWCVSRCDFSRLGESQMYSSQRRQANRSYSSSWSSVRWQRSGLCKVDKWDLRVDLSLNPVGLSALACWVQLAKGQ